MSDIKKNLTFILKSLLLSMVGPFLETIHPGVNISSLPKQLRKKRVVVIMCTGLGNSIMTLPLIYFIRKQYTPAVLDGIVANNSIKKCLERTDQFDNVYKYGHTFFDNVLLIRELLRKRYDVAFLSFPTQLIKYELIPFLIGARKVISHDYSLFHPYFRFIKKSFSLLRSIKFSTHDTKQNLFLLDGMYDFNQKIEYPPVKFNATEKKFADEYFQNIKKEKLQNNIKIIGIQAGSKEGSDYKRWPLEKYIKLAELLEEQKRIKVIFFIGPDEMNMVNNIEKKGLFTTKYISFDMELAIIDRCDIFITNDSGIMHAADLLGKPIVTIWGGSDEKRNGPVGRNTVNITSDLNCRPCMTFTKKYDCPEEKYKCLKVIKVEEVYKAVINLMNKMNIRE